jgi:ELWxxDGT repeat protein
LTAVNGSVLFSATDPAHGYELWKTNGTAAGTVMVQDIAPGSVSSSPSLVTDMGPFALFVATDGSHGRELWRTDGTIGGATMVKDINPGSADSNAANLTESGGLLFFDAFDPTHGTEVWRSDGTPGGTMILKDIFGGAGGSRDPFKTGYGSNRPLFADVGGTTYFGAFTPSSGSELWKTDGTTAGTVLEADIYASNEGSNPNGLVSVNGHLVFFADDGRHGQEPWRGP